MADAGGVLAKIRNHMAMSKETYDGVFTLVRFGVVGLKVEGFSP